MLKTFYVYILTNKKNGTLYIGMTNDLYRRILEHKNKLNSGFTKKYNVDRLVYYEKYDYVNNAILREKRIKKWNRKWKIELIESYNSNWDDLFYIKYGDFKDDSSNRFPLSRE